jgi:hypothetical protein
MARYDFSLDFEYPICGAPPKEKCVMMSGNFRSESHVERNWIAKDHQPKWSITQASPAEKLKLHTSRRSGWEIGQGERQSQSWEPRHQSTKRPHFNPH